MRTIDDIEYDIITYLERNPRTTVHDIGIALCISPRLLNKILRSMTIRGKLEEIKI